MRLISILEMARLLRVRRERAYQMVRKGILPPGVVVRMGRSLRIDHDKLSDWMAAGGSRAWKQPDNQPQRHAGLRPSMETQK